MSALLNIQNLTVKFPTRFGEFTALDSVSLDVRAGEIHGLVGESGAGKSTVGAAIMGVLQIPGYIANGNIHFGDMDLAELDDVAHHRIRGNRISMIFQDPQTSLNPLLRISAQLVETIRQHDDVSTDTARKRAIELLKETGLSDVEKRIDDYPHQFSGGMRQRVVIALALCTNPELIIADEPTTALDVAVQKQILELIRSLCTKRNIGIILITHDIGVINEVTDRVTVLRAGHVVEAGPTPIVLGQPSEQYTRALMAAVPRLDKRLDRFRNIVSDNDNVSGDTNWHVAGASADFAANWLLSDREDTITDQQRPGNEPSELTDPVLEVSDLSVTFNTGSSGFFGGQESFKALDKINLRVMRGEVLGLVGESGSGKSTLAKAIVGLVNPDSGSMRFNGMDLPPRNLRNRKHEARRKIQMVFQDPYSSLNNRRTVQEIIAEPIRFYKLSNNKNETLKIVASILELVEMPQRAMLKYPHQFSGGQRQRIAVARSLVARPEFLICDEPTSALDVSIQAQILNLLKDLQQAFGLSILFISHNLAVIRQMSDRVVVLRHGELIEEAETEKFFSQPEHRYSQQLLAETPSLTFLEKDHGYRSG